MSFLDTFVKVMDFAVANEATIVKVFAFLQKYGYLVKDPSHASIEDIIQAIMELQGMVGLAKTGIVDANLLRIIELPRCSHKDNIIENSEQLTKWNKNRLNFYINKPPLNISQDVLARAVIDALTEIEKVCNLQFTLVGDINSADLILGGGRGPKDDFDGPSGTLAWFELPPTTSYSGPALNGEMDEDETWVYPSGRGILAKNVLCHEIIHSVGMPHSKDPNALMASFYSAAIDKPQADDIARLVARYGQPVNPPSIPSNPSIPTAGKSTIAIGSTLVPGTYQLTRV